MGSMINLPPFGECDDAPTLRTECLTMVGWSSETPPKPLPSENQSTAPLFYAIPICKLGTPWLTNDNVIYLKQKRLKPLVSVYEKALNQQILFFFL